MRHYNYKLIQFLPRLPRGFLHAHLRMAIGDGMRGRGGGGEGALQYVCRDPDMSTSLTLWLWAIAMMWYDHVGRDQRECVDEGSGGIVQVSDTIRCTEATATQIELFHPLPLVSSPSH